MLKLQRLVWSEETERHVWSKHRVATAEAEEAAYFTRLVAKGRGKGVYEIFGRTEAGRYLLVVVRLLGKGAAKLITARSMTATEQQRYKRCLFH